MRYVTREEMQEIDRRAIEERKIPVDVLMGNAGKAVADLVEERISRDCPIVAVCGRGNNGGDGFAAARLLAERGFEVEVIALQKSYDLGTATGRAWHAAREGDVHFAGRFKRRPMTCVIDAIFGTGLSRAGITAHFIAAHASIARSTMDLAAAAPWHPRLRTHPMPAPDAFRAWAHLQLPVPLARRQRPLYHAAVQARPHHEARRNHRRA